MVHYFPDGTYIDFGLDRINHFRFEYLLLNIAQEKRYSNQANLSVLEHSMAVGKAIELMFPGNTLLIQHGYLHDISEAIHRDLHTEIKKEIGAGWYAMEKNISDKILDYLRIGPLGDDDAEILHAMDKTMMFVEAVNFFSADVAEDMKRVIALRPEMLVYCTTAFNVVQGMPLWAEEGTGLNRGIVELYKQIICASFI